MMHPIAQQIKTKFDALKPILDERQRRLWAATEARALGRGGLSRVVEATGLSAVTVRAGLRELRQGLGSALTRIRGTGGGRRRLIERDARLLPALEALVEPGTRGDPQSPLRWTCKSTAKLAAALTAQGHRVSPRTVNTLLHRLGYSLQAPRKVREGGRHPDRDGRFRYINAKAKGFQRRAQPVISTVRRAVDTKKKELVGDFYNKGREWRPCGQPEPVRVYDFIDRQLGKAIPYGVYDPSANRGWVSVGIDHDTAEFAVATIRRWWHRMGAGTYRDARRLLIIADGGGANSSRCRLWKLALQQLADETGLQIAVSHLPPDTSKWNKIEHRMFCHITENWRGRPLISHQVVVNAISSTTTTTGLTIRAELDQSCYPISRKVTPAQMEELAMKRHKFHGDWNYTLLPRSSK